jgi:hypothetical protein
MNQMTPIMPRGHSPLGGSSMKRAIMCPGSVPLSFGIDDEEDDTFSRPGSCAHRLSEMVLGQAMATTLEVWRWIGFPIDLKDGGERIVVDKEMADAVQVYMDFVQDRFPDRNQGNTFIEQEFHCPSLHQYFWGATDFTYADWDARHLHVLDYKHGAGLVVEVEDNVQCMYYACAMLERLDAWDKVDEITMWIVQPRIDWHPDGMIRSWTIPTLQLEEWMFETLIPAMDRAMVSRDTKSGSHCRFCPAAGRACPQILKDMEEMATMIEQFQLTDENQAPKLTIEQADRFYEVLQGVKAAAKNVERVLFGMLQAGAGIKNAKLVPAKANRKWKPEAEKEALKTFGEKAFAPKKLRSPAQMEELIGGEAFAARHAFKPDAGLTVAPMEDARKRVNKDVKSGFKPVKRGK